jgi:NDP-sugar pyrophosphorylase family protein
MKPIHPGPQAIILCGGKGTRLSSLYSDRPKILVPIAGRPFLEWQLEWLGQAGITDIHLAAGFMADVLGGWLEARGQRSEVGGQRSEVGGQKERGGLDSTSHASAFTIHLSRLPLLRARAPGDGWRTQVCRAVVAQ